tara:strand:+ start:115 stop:294 length:180 start_codon:yes stop_codon:yes gene_type:complete
MWFKKQDLSLLFQTETNDKSFVKTQKKHRLCKHQHRPTQYKGPMGLKTAARRMRCWKQN